VNLEKNTSKTRDATDDHAGFAPGPNRNPKPQAYTASEKLREIRQPVQPKFRASKDSKLGFPEQILRHSAYLNGILEPNHTARTLQGTAPPSAPTTELGDQAVMVVT